MRICWEDDGEYHGMGINNKFFSFSRGYNGNTMGYMTLITEFKHGMGISWGYVSSTI